MSATKVFNTVDFQFVFESVESDWEDAFEMSILVDQGTCPTFVLHWQNEGRGHVDLGMVVTVPGGRSDSFTFGRVDFVARRYVPCAAVQPHNALTADLLGRLERLREAVGGYTFELLDEEDLTDLYVNLVHEAVRHLMASQPVQATPALQAA